MINRIFSTIKRVCLKHRSMLALLGVLTMLASGQAYADGPTKINWVKVCGKASTWDSGYWVAGLADGKNIYGVFHSAQARSAYYSLVLMAYSTGKDVYYENIATSPTTACGVSGSYLFNPGPSAGGTPNARLMVSD